MPDDPSQERWEQKCWDQCAAVVSRLESRLRSPADRDTFQSTAIDLTDSLAPVSATIIGCRVDGETTEPIAAAGDRASGAADLRCSEWLGDVSQLTIEIWISAADNLSATERQAIEETARALCGLLVSVLARIRLRETEHELQGIYETTSKLFCQSESAERLHRIAVELGRTLDVDRLSLLRRIGGRYEFLASSVQARFDARAQRVLETRSVAACLGKLDFPDHTPLVIAADESNDRVIDVFLDSGECEHLVATKWSAGDLMAIGESFPLGRHRADQHGYRLSDAKSSLFEAATLDAIRSQPRGVVQRLRGSLSRLSSRRRTVTLAGLFALLMIWPTTIRIVADGRVVPRSQHVVYSPVNGEIERIDCETGTEVTAQQILCVFSSHDLDRDISRLRGEALTVREQLRIATTRRGEESAKEIASDRRVLEVRLRGLDEQLELLEERQANLVVRSPIAGVVSLVAPDDLGSLAAGRPIQVGQSVIRVIDADAGYRVELEIPDEEIGYVVAAMNRQEQKPVRCQFRIRSDPEMERSGELIKLEQTATPNRLGQLVVLGKVEPTDRNVKFASESGVTGWVECNRSAAGFVLFRKVIERLRIGGWL